jgi:tRNA(Ile)-lysidine synthase
VLTGHTRDDWVETIVMHFLRGTGSRGLRGIAERERLSASSLGDTSTIRYTIELIRPLLHVRRADTVAYCEARGLRWLVDETNVDPAFARNRVRGHLLPVMRTYNPAIDLALVRMAELVGDEDAWLHEVARQSWAEARDDPVVDEILNLAAWRRLPVPIQRRIVRYIAQTLDDEEIGYDGVERALAVGRADGPPRAELGHGIVVERRADTLIFIVPPRVQHD